MTWPTQACVVVDDQDVGRIRQFICDDFFERRLRLIAARPSVEQEIRMTIFTNADRCLKSLETGMTDILQYLVKSDIRFLESPFDRVEQFVQRVIVGIKLVSVRRFQMW